MLRDIGGRVLEHRGGSETPTYPLGSVRTSCFDFQNYLRGYPWECLWIALGHSQCEPLVISLLVEDGSLVHQHARVDSFMPATALDASDIRPAARCWHRLEGTSNSVLAGHGSQAATLNKIWRPALVKGGQLKIARVLLQPRIHQGVMRSIDGKEPVDWTLNSMIVLVHPARLAVLGLLSLRVWQP